MTGRIRWMATAAALAVLAGSAGCTGDPEAAAPEAATPAPTNVVSPLDDCAGLAAPPPEAPASGAGDTGRDDHGSLPELSLPCFTGAEPVALSHLSGPAVVNLWASWCPPCRDELPVLQRYAEDTAAHVHVVGVVTQDTRAAAAAFATDAGVTFPGVYDRDGLVRASLPGVGLPVTLFVDAERRILHLHEGPLDADTLAQLSAEHLGVAG